MPGVWQLAEDSFLSLLAHGDEEETVEGETELKTEGGNGRHLEHKGCS